MYFFYIYIYVIVSDFIHLFASEGSEAYWEDLDIEIDTSKREIMAELLVCLSLFDLLSAYIHAYFHMHTNTHVHKCIHDFD